MTAESNGGPIALRPAWKLSNPKIAEDAKAFWKRLGVLSTAEAERRISELCAAAYSGETLIGLATAYLESSETLRSRVAHFRCLVAPSEGRNETVRALAVLSRDLLEQWSRDNPQEEVMAMAATIPTNAYPDIRGEPVWAEGGLNLNLVGYSRAGEQLRVSWFGHARVV